MSVRALGHIYVILCGCLRTRLGICVYGYVLSVTTIIHST